jgi:phytoene synthase
VNIEPGDPQVLDSNHSIPPGSLRHLAILFSPEEKRSALAALYVVASEIFASADLANHDVAHTRLEWWRREIDRLVAGVPQHPAARLLVPLRGQIDLGILAELPIAAELDLARFSYESASQVDGYAKRAGGVLQAVATRWLAAPATPAPATVECVMRLGAAVRKTETLRDVRQDACDGRIYWPLDEFEHSGIDPMDLKRTTFSDRLKAMLRASHERLARELQEQDAAVPGNERRWARHTIVLARLHRALLETLARHGYDVATRRVELGSFARVWYAWRAARSAR